MNLYMNIYLNDFLSFNLVKIVYNNVMLYDDEKKLINSTIQKLFLYFLHHSTALFIDLLH